MLERMAVCSDPENSWFSRLDASHRPLAKLRAFTPHYYYFSLRQIHAFAGILRHFEPHDRGAMLQVSEVLYEELGEGDPRAIHSVLLEDFYREIGGAPSDLTLHKSQIAPGVVEYVDRLYAAFWGDSRPAALATYCFLENSALQTYPRMVGILEGLGVSPEAFRFFALHATLEVEHAAAAQTLAQKYLTAPAHIEEFNCQFRQLAQIWDRFWTDISCKTDAF